MYESHIFEVQGLQDMVQWANDEGHKIITSGYITETSQIYMVFELAEPDEDTAEKPEFNLFRPENERQYT